MTALLQKINCHVTLNKHSVVKHDRHVPQNDFKNHVRMHWKILKIF